MTQARERSKVALSAFVRQEFGAPVETIIGLAEILIEDAAAEDALAADLARIRDAGTQLLGLLGQLLETAPRLAGRPAEEIAFTKAKLMVYLVSFQNGFFWKSFFERRQKAVEQEASTH